MELDKAQKEKLLKLKEFFNWLLVDYSEALSIEYKIRQRVLLNCGSEDLFIKRANLIQRYKTKIPKLISTLEEIKLLDPKTKFEVFPIPVYPSAREYDKYKK
jgi:hypothetical protein